MSIPSEFLWFLMGVISVIVVVGAYEVLFFYSDIKELEEETKNKPKGWAKKGFKNLLNKIKKGKKKKGKRKKK